MYTSPTYSKNISTQGQSNSQPSLYNQISNYSQGTQQNLGSYRTSYSYDDPISSALTAAFPSWRQSPPSSITLREKTLHLAAIELRIEDYYLIRTRKLKQIQLNKLQNCIQNNCFNKQLLENECYRLFPYSSQKQVNLNDLRSSQNFNSSKNNLFNPAGNVGNSSNIMPAMFNSSTKTYGANNVFSNSLKEGNNQGSNIYLNSQNNSIQASNSNANAFNKPKEGNITGNSNNTNNPFNQAFLNRTNLQNTGHQNMNKSNQMAPQNQFASNNSSNSNVFGQNSINKNFNQGNNSSTLQNTSFISSQNTQNNQGKSFVINNQQPIINNQTSSNQNLLFASYNNNQQNHQNSANISPQFYYNNYQNIANQIAQFNFIVKQIEQVVKKNIQTSNSIFKQTPLGFLTTFPCQQELLKKDFYYQQTVYYRELTRKRQQQQSIKVIINQTKRPSKRLVKQTNQLFKKNSGFLPVQSRYKPLNDSSLNNDLYGSRVTVINQLKSSRIDQICHSIVYQNNHTQNRYICNALFIIKWKDISIPDKKIESKQPFRLEEIDFGNPKNLSILLSILKRDEHSVREDAQILINYQKSNFSNFGNIMIVGVIEQRAVNLDPQCYEWSYQKIQQDKIYGLCIVKRVKNIKKTAIVWENPINYLNLDFMGNQGFNLDLCEVVCQLPQLNSRCRITFTDLPCKIKKIYHQKGYKAAFQRMQQFINKLNDYLKLFSLCQINQNGTWTLIAQKFF